MVDEIKKDDDFDIDFSKIIDFFKKGFQQIKNLSSPQTTDHRPQILDDDFSFDFSKIVSFIKNNSTLCILLLVLLLQFLPNYGFLPWGGVWMRMQTQDLSRFDELAANSVSNQLVSQISSQVNQKYPNLPSEQKQKIIDEFYKNAVREKKSEMDAVTQSVANEAKDFYRYEFEGVKYTYMPDIDPYTFLRRAKNLVEKGQLGDEVKNGKQWDNHMQAPLGNQVEESIHPYVLFVIHKVFSFFNSKIPLMQSVTYFPILFTILSLFPAFFLGRKLAGNLGGFFSATFVAVHPSFLGRTQWGHADTDAYNVFFPLTIAWLFIECVSSKEIKTKILAGFFAGFATGVYSYIWSWWYLFDFFLAAIFIHLVYLAVKNVLTSKDKKFNVHNLLTQDVKNTLYSFAIIVLFTGVFVTFFSDFNAFISGPLGPLGFQTIRDASLTNLWPNVYTTFAELNPLSVKDAINQINQYVFLISLAGLVLLFFARKEENKHEHSIFSIAFFVLWLLATLYATTKGTRFLLLTVPALAIGFGCFAGLLHEFVSKFAQKEFGINKKIVAVVILVVLSFSLSSSVSLSYAASRSDIPLVNDAWWNTLQYIKDNSNKDAIVNSWWDFGHHFKYISDRAVTFDGATQNTPLAHWVGKVLLTSNEKEAIGILRMLDCGSNNAFEFINNRTNDTLSSINALYSIFQLDKSSAREILKKTLNDSEDIEKILQLTHCNPPENFFITSDDMIGKSGVWAHFGSWNFERAYIWIKLRNEPKEKAIAEMISKLKYSEDEAKNIYNQIKSISNENEANVWIAPWPTYVSDVTPCSKNEEKVSCQNVLRVNGNTVPVNIEVNLTSADAKIFLPNKAVLTPKYLQYFNDKKEFIQKEYPNSTLDGGIILIPADESNFMNTIVPTSLLNSMFTRLYFVDGQGLKNFKLVNRQAQKFGGPITTWKVDWTGKEPNLISTLKEKEIVDVGSNVKVNYIMWTEVNKSIKILDSSIADWQNKNITPKSEFSNSENPKYVQIDAIQVQKPGLASSLLGMKKGETKSIELNPIEAYGENAANFPFGNQTIKFKVKVEMIK